MAGEASKPKRTLEKVIAARNESNPEIRSRLLKEALSAHATFTDREGREHSGWGAISQLIAAEVLDPEHWVELKGPVSPIGDRYVFRWQVGSSISDPQAELCWLELDGDGKVERLTVRHSVDAPTPLGQQVFQWSRDHPAPALAVAAGILYAILRISMAIFYNQLGMTPEEAGFTNDELLRQSVTLLGAFLLYGLILVVVNLLITVPMARVLTVSRRLGLAQAVSERRLILILVIAPAVVSYLAAIFLSVRGSTTTALVAFATFALSLVLVPRVVLFLPAAKRVTLLAEESLRRSRHLRPQRIFGSVAGGLAALFLISLPALAYFSADEVRGGGTATARLFPWRALPAMVSWNVEPPPVELAMHCRDLRFLGEDGGRVFLFDQLHQRTVRISAKEIVVSTKVEC